MKSSMKIKSVNIRGMKNVKNKTYEFSDMNYIQGPNGSGKSTILNAIQYAILGYIPGTPKTNAGVASFMNSYTMEVTVEFETDDNKTVLLNRRISKTGRSYRQDVSIEPPYVDIDEIAGNCKLPIYDWQEFENLTANKSKDWFISFLPSHSVEINWESQLRSNIPDETNVSDDFISAYVTSLSKIQGETAVEILSEANGCLKQDLSYKKALLDDTKALLSNAVKNADVEDNDSAESLEELYSQMESVSSEYNDCQSELKSLEVSLEAYERSLKAKQDMESQLIDESKRNEVTSKLKSLDSERENLEALVSECDEKCEQLKAEFKLHDFDSTIASIQACIEQNRKIAERNGICPYTSGHCDYIESIAGSCESEVDELKQKIERAEADRNLQIDSIKSAELERIDARTQLNQVNQNIAVLNQALANNDRIRSQIRSFELDFDLESVTKEYTKLQSRSDLLRSGMEHLQQSIYSAKEHKANEEKISSLIQKKDKIENEIEALKSWIGLTGENGLQTTMSKSVFADLERDLNVSIQDVFGEGVNSTFRLDTKANSFSFGITKDDTYIPYNLLSTGEKASYAVSLMLYIVDHGNSKLPLVMIDDMFDHLDLNRFKLTFNSMRNHNDRIQIIAAGVADVSDCDFEGLNVIQL